MARKTSDTIAVMGNGYSINSIQPQEWLQIESTMDTIGMNWWCNAGRNTTFYVVREQAVSPARLEPGGMPEDFVRKINSIKTTLIVKEKRTHKWDTYFHTEHLDEFVNDGIVVQDMKYKGESIVTMFATDFFVEPMVHHFTMCDIMHFATFMQYRAIVFFGVDLYDQRYFWLGPAETKAAVLRRKETWETPHATAPQIVPLIQNYQKVYPDVKLSVHNPKSLLASIIPVWKCP
jgi:hypothetical protein